MTILWLLFSLTCFLCVLLTPLAHDLATKAGLVDLPDGGRKTHSRPIPLAGGLAVFLSSAIALLATWLLGWSFVKGGEENWTFLFALLTASTFICILGIVDDFVMLSRALQTSRSAHLGFHTHRLRSHRSEPESFRFRAGIGNLGWPFHCPLALGGHQLLEPDRWDGRPAQLHRFGHLPLVNGDGFPGGTAYGSLHRHHTCRGFGWIPLLQLPACQRLPGRCRQYVDWLGHWRFGHPMHLQRADHCGLERARGRAGHPVFRYGGRHCPAQTDG